MDRAKLIERLVGAEKVPFGAEALGGMTDEQLQSLADNYGCGCPEGEPAPVANAQDEPTTEPKVEPTPALPFSAEEIEALKGLAKDRGTIDTVLADATAHAALRKEEKDALVEQLVSNERCPIPEGDLRVMSVEGLRQTARAFASAPTFNFGGRGGPRGNASETDDTPKFAPVRDLYTEIENENKGASE